MDENASQYDKEYFQSHCGLPYTRENFLPFFKEIANHIQKEINPRTVLDAGCAMGFLVESLRDLGIEAYGIDISDYAINQARDNIKKYVKKQSILDPLDKQYDLIICIEVLEHLPEKVAEKAIENLCNNSNIILFSSTPLDKTEPTHQNVQDVGYWSSHFAKFGFIEQANHDLSYVNSHAILFKKVKKIQSLDIVKSYSNGVYSLKNSLSKLKSLNHERLSLITDLQRILEQRDNQLKERDNQLKERDNQLKERESQLKERDNQLKENYNQLKERDSQLKERDNQLKENYNQLKERDSQLKQFDENIQQLQQSIQVITTSVGYNMILRFRGYWNKRFPPKSRRRKYADALMLKVFGNLFEIKTKDDRTKLRKNKAIKLSSLTADAQYKLWLENHSISEKEIGFIKKEIYKFKLKPKISIVMPVYNVDKIWLSTAIDSVRNQIYDNWELCIVDDASSKNNLKSLLDEYSKLDKKIKIQYLSKNLGIAGASNKAIELATGDYVGFLDNDDCLYPDGLFEIVKRINEKPDAEILYSDEDKIDSSGQRVDPYFKADWSPDLLMTGNYITHFCVFHDSVIKSLKGLRLGYDGSQDYDLLLRATDKPRKVEHIPKVLYGWRMISGSAAASANSKPYAHSASLRALEDTLNRRGKKGTVVQVSDTLHYRVRYDYGNPFVSIIFVAQNDIVLLKKTINSIESASYRNFELIIVDNKRSKDITNFLVSCGHKIINGDPRSNLSELYNMGAYQAKGEILLFLSDVEPTTSDWMESMLESLHADNVGVVGPMLTMLYDSNNSHEFIENAGTVVGVGGIASNAFSGFPVDIMRYRNVHLTIRNCSAVNKKCMLIKKKIFEEIGGWDEKMQEYNDIDFCFRVTNKGYRIVYTPYARLIKNKTNSESFNKDDKMFREKWNQKLETPDPFYNENLSQISASYSISPYSNLPRSLSALMEVYLNNEHLQDKFPEAKSGNLRNLLQWVLEFGIKNDVSFFNLKYFEKEFKKFYDESNRMH